ncbi:hypothetical protein V8E54_007066 [Elaphomyces granulatus]
MGGGRAFDIDAFLEFMPAQEGEAWEKREEHHLGSAPLNRTPWLPTPSPKLKKFSSSASSSLSLHSKGNSSQQRMIGRHSQERNREKAGGRDFQSDRVESMRREDWKSHKETCTGNQKYICLLIHPLMSSSGPESRDMLMDCMEPFHLKSYGNWGAEMRELRERLGWAKADEAGKFYSHQGDDTWYYYVYYPPTLTLPPWLRLSTTGKEANMMPAQSLHAPFLQNWKPAVNAYNWVHFPSYAANAKFLLHSRPSPPICPLLTCISQSAQSLHSPFLQNGKFLLFRSLPNRVAFLKSLLPHGPQNEPDFFYANLKYLALLGTRT